MIGNVVKKGEGALAARQAQQLVTHPISRRCFELVIFDCDGVLIDSEVISTRTLLETLATHGLDVDLGYIRKTYLGRSMTVVKTDYRRRMGRELAATFETEFLGRLFAAYRRDLAAMQGVYELLTNLTVPYCMATSSSLDRAMFSLEVTGLLPFFAERIFCASMVENGKPAPDLFLFAARALATDPARCLVIEDSEVGLLAARNAGMTAWRFVGGSHLKCGVDVPLDANDSVPRFESMDHVAAALRSPAPSGTRTRPEDRAGQA
jgi:HAD superfamily hydrolase (TIGR01509 family)